MHGALSPPPDASPRLGALAVGQYNFESCFGAKKKRSREYSRKEFIRMSNLFKRFYVHCSWYLLMFTLKKITAAYLKTMECLKGTARSYIFDIDLETLRSRNLCACARTHTYARTHRYYVCVCVCRAAQILKNKFRYRFQKQVPYKGHQMLEWTVNLNVVMALYALCMWTDTEFLYVREKNFSYYAGNISCHHITFSRPGLQGAPGFVHPCPTISSSKW